MEGIFFVIHPVWWAIPISYSSILISIVGGVCIGIALGYLNYKKSQQSKQLFDSYLYQPVESTDSQYASKTLSEIRRYLSTQHYPRHSWAHIPQDIKTYNTDKDLHNIIEQLEASEYSKIGLDKNTINYIHKTLFKKLRP